jgi:hypothetical protein
MSKKTVSVLLLLILTLAIALFSFTSCKNDPAPTAAPRAGEIPSIPNNQTKINSLGVTQKDTLSTLFNDVAEFFVSYADTYGLDDSDEPLYELMNDPFFSLDKNASIFASESSGTFRDKAYSHTEIAGFIGVFDDEDANGFVLSVDTTVTAEGLFANENEIIHAEFCMHGEDWLKIFIGEKNDDYATPDILFDYGDGNIYLNGSTTALSDGEAIAENQKKIDFLMFVGLKALSNATIDFENVTLTDSSDENPTSMATLTINGQIKLSGIFQNNSTDFDATDFDDFDIEDLFSSFTVSVESLSIQAAVATDATTSEGDKSELMALTLSVKNLSLSAQYETAGEPEVSTLKCDKLSLSLSNSDADVVFSLELSDADFAMTFDMGLEDLEGSATIGLGAKAGENSVGLLTDFEFTMGSFTGLPYVTFTPKAAVINGAFYSTKDAKDLLIEYCDMLVAFLRQRAYA